MGVVCVAVIAVAVALIAGGGPEPPAAQQPPPRATFAPAIPSSDGDPGDRQAAKRPEEERRNGDRRGGGKRSRSARRTADRRMTTAGAGPEADRMRREALRRHAERMRGTVELRRPDGPECEVPDAFDVPGCEPR